jgi:hypothetical protein
VFLYWAVSGSSKVEDFLTLRGNAYGHKLFRAEGHPTIRESTSPGLTCVAGHVYALSMIWKLLTTRVCLPKQDSNLRPISYAELGITSGV